MSQNMRNQHSLYKVKHRYTVSHRAQDRISIRSEYDIPLSIDSATKIRELRGHDYSRRGEELGPCFTLKLAFITLVRSKKKTISELGGTGTDQNTPPSELPLWLSVGVIHHCLPNVVRYFI